jgi:hypothetical protein
LRFVHWNVRPVTVQNKKGRCLSAAASK